jgi:tRNA U34 2-thiouridine synthase MnmA/TrmU
VDSSVAAALLVQQGFEVIGATLKLQECLDARESRSCCGVDGIARARAVAGQLGIPHYVVDCVSKFEELVLRPAWEEYASGRTPNPCLLCNERVKLGLLLDWARGLGASRIATGHYARVSMVALTGDHECEVQDAKCKVQDGQASRLSATIRLRTRLRRDFADHPPSHEASAGLRRPSAFAGCFGGTSSTITDDRRSTRFCLEGGDAGASGPGAPPLGAGAPPTCQLQELSLLRGIDRDKDQSYFLAGLTKEQLGSLLFPIGHLTKPEVRALARSLGLDTSAARESQDACLVAPGQSFAEMLKERFHGQARPGPVLDAAGNVLGRHVGLHLFTVGQRRGIPIQSPHRHWVMAIRRDEAAVVVTSDERQLLGDRLVASGVSWLADPPHETGRPPSFRCQVQVRYRHAAEEAIAERTGADSVLVRFERPVQAITPGQAAVFYDGESVLGRGWIDCGWPIADCGLEGAPGRGGVHVSK